MKSLRNILLLGLLCLTTGTAQALTLVADNSGGTPCVTGDAFYATVQGAVSGASAGDTILVCPGTYEEQVTIGTSGLTVESATVADPALPQATIKAPSTLSSPNATVGSGVILWVDGATNVTIENLTISGPGPGSCGSIEAGIYVGGGGSADIENNAVQNIRDDPFSGCQNGVGILVGRQYWGEFGNATINNNDIEGYQKGGIVVDNTGSTATITGNIITGAGKTTVTAQNGIQVSRGASASAVTGNAITGNFYSNAGGSTVPYLASGILYYQAGQAGDEGQLERENTLRHNVPNVMIVQ